MSKGFVCLLLSFLLFQSVVFGGEFSGFRDVLWEKCSFYQLKNDPLLNPNLSLAPLSSWKNTLENNLFLKYEFNALLDFVIKNRTTLNSDKFSSDIPSVFDNAYFNWDLTDITFITLGKQNLQEGVGLSYNPSDFLNDGKTVDPTKRIEDQKADREGSYILKLQTLFNDVSCYGMVIPKLDQNGQNDGVLFKVSRLVGDSDVALNAIVGERSGIGFNASGVVGDALELHLETACRQGSLRKTFNAGQVISAESNVYLYEATDLDDPNQYYLRAVLGGHYTFENEVNIILEYINNGDGFSAGAWERFAGIVSENWRQYKAPPPGFSNAIFAQNLGVANGVMDYGKMRRNYVFCRFWNPTFLEKIDAQAYILHNADDGSGVYGWSVDYQRWQNYYFTFDGMFFSGEEDSEFGLVAWNSQVSLGLKCFW